MDDTAPYALVVDDDSQVRMDAVYILEDAGFRTLEAFDVDSAIRTLEQSGDDIQLLFTDVQMPGSRNGFALARECSHGCASYQDPCCIRSGASWREQSASRSCVHS